MNNKIKIPLVLAWEIMACLQGIVIQEGLDELNYKTQGRKIRDEFSKLLEPYRKGGE